MFPNRLDRRGSTAAWTLAALGSIATALLVAEIALRAFWPQIYPTVPPGLLVMHPDGMPVLAPGVQGRFERVEFSTAFRVGTQGLRGEDLRPRREDTFRILALGSSDTFGYGVEDHEAYPARLEVLLRQLHPEIDVQVLNGGVPGHGTLDEGLWLRAVGPEVRPDLILLQFVSQSDFYANQDPPKRSILTGTGESPPTEEAPPPDESGWASRVVRPLHGLKERSHVAALVIETASYLGLRAGLLGNVASMWGEEFTAEDARQTREALGLVAREASALGVPIVFLYTTGKAPVVVGEGPPPPSEAVVRAAAEAARAPWIDVAGALRTREDHLDLYFVRDGHWTPAGHEAVAETVAVQLTNRGLVP